MGVIFYRRDGDDYTKLGVVRHGEIIAGDESAIRGIVFDPNLTDEDALIENHRGPHVIAVDEEAERDEGDISKTVEKDGPWVPYRGPRGGVGWQNADDGEIVYQDDPPGEVADGFQFIDEVNSTEPETDEGESQHTVEGDALDHEQEGSLTSRIREITDGNGENWEKKREIEAVLEDELGSYDVGLGKASTTDALKTAEVVSVLHDHVPDRVSPFMLKTRPPRARPSAAGGYDWDSEKLELHPQHAYDETKSKQYYRDKKKASGHPLSTVFHELGHHAHHERLKDLGVWVNDDGGFDQNVWSTITNQDIQDELPDGVSYDDLRNEVSTYSGQNPLEFVAEVWTGALTGHEYPEWVWDMYESFGGPKTPDIHFPYEIESHYQRSVSEPLPAELRDEADIVWASFQQAIADIEPGDRNE